MQADSRKEVKELGYTKEEGINEEEIAKVLFSDDKKAKIISVYVHREKDRVVVTTEIFYECSSKTQNIRGFLFFRKDFEKDIA